VILSGPYQRQIPRSGNFTHSFGMSVSTYPHPYDRQLRDGDPVCDSYRVHIARNYQVITVADGCGWGEPSMQASQRLRDNVVDYFTKEGKSFRSLREISEHLITAIALAHYHILADKKILWMAGSTTGICGLMVELDRSKDSTLPPWAFVFVSIGDCKCFRYNCESQVCEDVTSGNRKNITDPRDPGGRIGPYNKKGDPDLRNLDLYWVGCHEGDIIIVVSDGVHDNLDPQFLGRDPSEFGIAQGLTWDDIPIEECSQIKTNFMNQMMTEVVLKDKEEDTSYVGMTSNPTKRILTPNLACKRLILHCQKITERSRQWMEQHPSAALETDYKNFPGKLDHTTAVACSVGYYDPTVEKHIGVQSLNPDSCPF